MTPIQLRMEAALAANPQIGRKRLMKEAQVSSGAAQRFLERARGKKPTAPLPPKTAAPRPTPHAPKAIPQTFTPPPAENVSIDYASDKASITTTSSKITNLDQALAAAHVDLNKWEVTRHTINHWDVTMKGENGQPLTVTNFQIRVWLGPKLSNLTFDALEKLTATLHGPQKRYTPLPAKTDPHMLEISLMDHHFGKLAWKPETGSDYDLKIAATLYQNAVYDLLQKGKGFGVDEILFPVGQDFFNIDNNAATTTGGTAQDCDGRLAKIFEVGCQSVLEAIDMCAEVAKVKVIWVPGNHDRTTSYYLCRYIEAWYRNVDRVEVDAAPKIRKYVPYGVNLLGYTHQGKLDSLPLLMMSENRDNLAGIRHMELHAGHYHKSKEMKFTAGDTFGPVIVRILPSLCGTDSWHYEQGYVGGRRAAEAYLYSKNSGYVGHFSAVAREH